MFYKPIKRSVFQTCRPLYTRVSVVAVFSHLVPILLFRLLASVKLHVINIKARLVERDIPHYYEDKKGPLLGAISPKQPTMIY